MVVRRIAAIAAAKGAAQVSRRFRLGGGTALPGLVAERLDPQIVRGMAGRLGRGSVLVTGTNGKTTTSRLLRSIARAAALKPVANRAGSNLMRGIAAALVESAQLSGSYSARQLRLGIFEVDEATLAEATRAVRPRAIVFNNLFRDQLDRYGEVEHVASVWRDVITSLPEATALVLNADDPAVASLADRAGGPVLYYGVEDAFWSGDRLEHAADARWCPSCSSELEYAGVFYGHLGHWKCGKCGTSRPSPTVVGKRVRTEENGLSLEMALSGSEVSASVPLTGLYNGYNALAAAAAATVLGIAADAVEKGLEASTAAFGRQERLIVRGRRVEVILAKNPAGLNQVLRTIMAGEASRNIVLFLNDNIADGRDVSWIWDVDFELLAGKVRSLTVSGRRAWDMALRLKYAGVDAFPDVEPDARQALQKALGGTPEGETLYVVPTYTAMLEVRDLLAKWGGRGAFWQEA
jgi:UDP-N-acetylmuramyl tripeptide synthase